MELRHFRSFVGVADAGTVSRAALRLNISQPALSRQIADLERELGVRLFDRIGHRLVLTRDGEEILGRSRRLLLEADSIRERAHSLAGGAGGVLRVGSTPQFIESAMPRILTRYRQVCPHVDVQLVEDGADGLVRRVRDGALDLAPGVTRRTEGLAVRALWPILVVAVTSRRHRLARRSRVSLADLADERLFGLAPGFQHREVLEEACRVAKIQLQFDLDSRSTASVLALAAAGLGVGILPSVAVVAGRAVHVAAVVHDGRPVGTWAYVVWDPRRYLPPHAEVFIDILTRQTAKSYPGYRIKLTRAVPRPAARSAEV
jgi:DNA-binding transcriptional LysR family regulator